MTLERVKKLRESSDSLSYMELVEIQSAFDLIPDECLRDIRENAVASDMLEEIECQLKG